MEDLLPSNPSHDGMYQGEPFHHCSHDRQGHGRWYYSWKELEENSPSKRDGITLKKETKLCTLYSKFLQDLGMRLKVPQITIATAVVFCHRFFLRQSHAKNDWMAIATVCMFLAGKVEETPHPLKDVIIVSYEIIHKEDPEAIQRIKQKEVYEQRKELILLGENVVLATLGFDLNVHHPYKPLVEAIKKFKVAQNALAQVAWNFVNDGLRTSLCLQFKPHQIAAGAIFLAAKFLKVKLPSDGERVWWQEFDVTPRQLDEVSNQMLELYEQNQATASKGGEVEGSIGAGALSRAPSSKEELALTETGGATLRHGTSVPVLPNPVSEQIFSNNHGEPPRIIERSNDYRSEELKSTLVHQSYSNYEDFQHVEPKTLPYQNKEAQNASSVQSDGRGEENQERIVARSERREVGELKDKYLRRNLENGASKFGLSRQEAIKKIDTDKVKAALENTRKSCSEITRKIDLMDVDDRIENDLEAGVELTSVSERKRQDRRQSWSTSSHRQEYENMHHGNHQENAGDIQHLGMKGQSSWTPDIENVEERVVSMCDDTEQGFRSAKSSNRKRKAGSALNKMLEVKQRHEYGHGSSHHYNHHDDLEDRNRVARLGYMERDQKRHVPEYHF